MDNYTFPPLDNDREDTADRIIAYQTSACSKEDPSRMARFLDYERARFTIGSKPWMATPENSRGDSPFFEPIEPDDPDVKLANRNESAPILDGEAARLIGSTSEPAVVPNKATTIVHRAAKKGKVVLDDILRQAAWTSLVAAHAKNAVDHGTSWFLGGWETDLANDPRKGPAKVHACTGPECKWLMLATGGEVVPGGGIRYGGDVGKEMFEAKVGTSVSQPDDDEFFSTLHECPECQAPLEPRHALPEDGDRDAFGYDLMEETPLAKAFVRHHPDIDVFPIGGGRMNHGFQPEVTVESIVSVDWLNERYKGAGEVQPKSMAELEEVARYHPCGLEHWGYSGRGLANDQKRWAVYRITIRKPFKVAGDSTKDEPLGRLMISANRTVLYNGPLLFEYEGPDGEKCTIPRLQLFPFANELQNNSVQGLSVYSRLNGPQEVLDAMFSQFQWDMAENGSPTVAIPMGKNLEGQGDGYQVDATNPGIPNRVVRYDASDGGKVEVIGGKVTHSDWQPFTEGIVAHMQRATGQSQLDQGKAVSSAPSASAQMYIGQRLDETRKPKGQRWAEHLEQLFGYLLDVVCAVYVEKRQFKAVDGFENRTFKDFTGADLMGQTNVKVKAKPSHDTEAFQRQNIIELIPLGLVDLSTPRQRLRVAKKLGSVEELDPEPNQQIQDAQNEFLGFTLDEPRVKMIAKKLTDDHQIHMATHMEDLRSQAGEGLRRFWSLHELATDGWMDKFSALMAAEKRLKTAPAAEPKILLDPMTGGPNLQVAAAQSRQKTEDELLRAEIEALPKNVQERIEFMQTGMVKAYPEFLKLIPEDQDDALALTEFLSHYFAHEWYKKEAEQAAIAAAMPPPPPGATPAPAAPSQGAPALPEPSGAPMMA